MAFLCLSVNEKWHIKMEKRPLNIFNKSLESQKNVKLDFMCYLSQDLSLVKF